MVDIEGGGGGVAAVLFSSEWVVVSWSCSNLVKILH